MAEDVEPLRELAGGGVGSDLVPHIERVFLALCQLFGRERAAGGNNAVLRRNMKPIGVARARGLARVGRRGQCR